jgi:hypothetical protein
LGTCSCCWQTCSDTITHLFFLTILPDVAMRFHALQCASCF